MLIFRTHGVIHGDLYIGALFSIHDQVREIVFVNLEMNFPLISAKQFQLQPAAVGARGLNKMWGYKVSSTVIGGGW